MIIFLLLMMLPNLLGALNFNNQNINEAHDLLGSAVFPQTSEKTVPSYKDLGLTYQQILSLGIKEDEPIIITGKWDGDLKKITTYRLRLKAMGMICSTCFVENKFQFMSEPVFFGFNPIEFFKIEIRVKCLDKLLFNSFIMFLALVPFLRLCHHFFFHFDLETIFTIFKLAIITFCLTLFLIGMDFLLSHIEESDNGISEDDMIGCLALINYFVLLAFATLILVNTGFFRYDISHVVFLMIILWLWVTGRVSYSLVIPLGVVYGLKAFRYGSLIFSCTGWIRIADYVLQKIYVVFSFLFEIFKDEMKKASEEKISEIVIESKPREYQVWFSGFSEFHLIILLLTLTIIVGLFLVNANENDLDWLVYVFYRFRVFLLSLNGRTKAKAEQANLILNLLMNKPNKQGEKLSDDKIEIGKKFKKNSGFDFGEILRMFSFESRADKILRNLKPHLSRICEDIDYPSSVEEWLTLEEEQARESWAFIIRSSESLKLDEISKECLRNKVWQSLIMDSVIKKVDSGSLESLDEMYDQIHLMEESKSDYNLRYDPSDEEDNGNQDYDEEEEQFPTSRMTVLEDSFNNSLNDADSPWMHSRKDNVKEKDLMNEMVSESKENNEIENGKTQDVQDDRCENEIHFLEKDEISNAEINKLHPGFEEKTSPARENCDIQ